MENSENSTRSFKLMADNIVSNFVPLLLPELVFSETPMWNYPIQDFHTQEHSSQIPLALENTLEQQGKVAWKNDNIYI